MRMAPLPPPSLKRGDRLRPAVFLDKDGTLVENVPYNVDPALLRFTPNAIAALRRLVDAGYLLVVISNQPGVALKRFDVAALQRLAAALTQLLGDEGVPLAGFYACPHAPAGASFGCRCRCRKPAPELLREAARELDIDLTRSWMIGDILDDVEAGWRAGCGSVLLDVGSETEWQWSPIRIPNFRVADLLVAAEAILASPPATFPRLAQRRPTIRRPAGAAARARRAA